MNAESSGETEEKSKLVQWKATRIGGEYVPYEDILQDPNLRKVIEPRHNFKIDYEGYTYSVKIYENGNKAVFRNKIDARLSEAPCSPVEIRKIFYNPRNIQLRNNQVGRNSVLDDNALKTIYKFKLSKLEEFEPESDWEIFHLQPIVTVKDEANVVLVSKVREPVSEE